MSTATIDQPKHVSGNISRQIVGANTSQRVAASPLGTAANKNEKEWKKEIHTPEAEYNANVPVDAIERDPANRVPAAADVAARAESIRAVGLLQPVVLRLIAPGKYRLMAGETRWLAFQELKRKTIPARIYKDQSEVDAATKALVENAQRADLTPIERAKRFKQLEELGKKQKEIGELAGGVSQPVVANAIRLLSLPADVQELVDKGELSEAHGVVLAKWAKWPRACSRMAKLCCDHGHSAKDIAAGGIPFGNQLIQEGLAEKIPIKQRPGWSDQIYKLPRHLNSHADFIIGEYIAFYFLPADPKENVWAPFKAEQDAEHAKKTAAEVKREEQREAKEESKQSGMSPAEAAARKKVIADNKQARAESGLARQAMLELLRDTKEIYAPALVVIAQKAFGHHHSVDTFVKSAAEGIGLTLPKGFNPDSLAWLAKLKPVDLLRLCAATLCERESECAVKFAWNVTEVVACVLGDKRTAAVKQEARDKLAGLAAAKEIKKAGIAVTAPPLTAKGKEEGRPKVNGQLDMSFAAALLAKTKKRGGA